MDVIYKNIIEAFREVPDPRVDRSKIHSLQSLLFIALCTFLTGGRSFYEMELFAQTQYEWLKQTVNMTSVPSHDTFNRIFQVMDPEHFENVLIEITNKLRNKVSNEIIAFDGKTHRGTGDDCKSALHMLNAWAVKNRAGGGALPPQRMATDGIGVICHYALGEAQVKV